MTLSRTIAFCAAGVLLSGMALAADFPAGQEVEVREGNIWSKATVVKKEGRKTQVRYSDGSEDWVTADRIRAGTGTNAPASEDVRPASPRTQSAVSLEGPFIELNIREVKGAPRRAAMGLKTKPATQPANAFVDLTPESGTGVNRVEALLPCFDKPGVFVATSGGRRAETTLLIIDTTALQPAGAVEVREFDQKEQQVLSALDRGRLLLTKSTKWGSKSMHLWEWREEEYVLKANYTILEHRENRHPEWAMLISPTRVVLDAGRNRVYLFDLATRQQVGAVEADRLRLHASGQYLLGTSGGNGLVIRPNDLAVIGSVPGAEPMFDVDPTGSFAAAGNGRELKVIRLPGNATVGRLSGLSGREVHLLSDRAVLSNGVYYDVKTGIPVWDYQIGNGMLAPLPNGQMLMVDGGRGDVSVCMATLPDAPAAAALAGVKPEQFTLSPGARIQITGDLNGLGNAEQARAALEKAVLSAGHTPDNGAGEYKLEVSAAAGKTGTFSVREFNMMGPPAVRDIPAPSTDVKVKLMRETNVIWEQNLNFSAQVMVVRQGNETLEQAVARAGRPEPDRLASLNLPSYIVKSEGAGKGTGTLGQSRLTREGFATGSGR